MRYQKFNASFFLKNRQKLVELLPENSIAIFSANDFLPTNADGTYGFTQSSTFFYLTGIDQEDCTLVLAKGLGEWLFITETSDLKRVWDGSKINQQEATEISGIQEVNWNDKFWNKLNELLMDKSEVYLYRDTIQQNKFRNFKSPATNLFFEIQEKYPLVDILNPAKFTDRLRLLKEADEVAALKRAISITHGGLLKAAKFIAPGKYEFEIEAELTHHFLMNRSRHHAFMPIIASGQNACILHYVENNSLCKDGDLVLIDFGAEYGNYKADMTRVLPVNGKFSDRQAEVYSSVLLIFKELRKLMVIGNTISNLKLEALNLLQKELVKLGLATFNDFKENKELVHKFLPHGVSHSLGLDVHDVGDRATPFEAGMVLTLEPGLYIPEENIGIRLENDILITANGNEDLMEGVPLEINEIEKIML